MVRSHETGVVASGPSSVIPWRSSSSRCFCLSLPKMDTLATTSASSRFFITFQRPVKMAGALITMSVVMNSGYVSANVAKYVRYLRGGKGGSVGGVRAELRAGGAAELRAAVFTA